MREIKFRAKVAENLDYPKVKSGDWAYGYSLRQYESGRMEIDGIYCDPDTLGQYTGIKDKNGKEIYEGDILDCNHFRYEVVWKDGGLMLRYNKVALYQFVSGGACMEVVGNVYDNRDLLTDK